MGFKDPMKEEGGCATAFDEAAAAGTPSADELVPLAAGASPAGGVAVACPTMAWSGTMFGY